jgi:hypothetical protein
MSRKLGVTKQKLKALPELYGQISFGRTWLKEISHRRKMKILVSIIL